jgi:hypothetical protein
MMYCLYKLRNGGHTYSSFSSQHQLYVAVFAKLQKVACLIRTRLSKKRATTHTSLHPLIHQNRPQQGY